MNAATSTPGPAVPGTVAGRTRTASRLAAVFLALIVGALAADVGAWLGNRFAPDLDLAAVAAAAYPDTPVTYEKQPRPYTGDPLWWRLLRGEFGYTDAWTVAPVRQPTTADEAQYRAAARNRLQAAGWQVGSGIEDSLAFEATRGGVRIDFYADVMESGGLTTEVYPTRLQPWWATAMALAAGLAGALLGWLLVGWVTRRTATRSDRIRMVIRQTTVISVVLAFPWWLNTVLGHAAAAFSSDRPLLLAVDVDRWSGGWTGLRFGFAALALLLLLATVVATSLARTPRR